MKCGSWELGMVENFNIAAAIKAALRQHPTTAHLDLDVEVDCDTVIFYGTVGGMREIAALERVAFGDPAGIKIDYTNVQIANTYKKLRA